MYALLKNKMMTAALFTLMLLVMPVELTGQTSAGFFNFNFVGVTNDFDNNRSTWMYTVAGTNAGQDLSHWVLALCPDHTVHSAGPNPWEVNTDPTSGLYGIKWDVPVNTNQSKTFTVTLNGIWEPGDIEFKMKAATNIYSGTITGPTCDLYGNGNGDDCDLTAYITFTQGGWGSPSVSEPGTIRDTYFSQVFPGGLVVGSGSNTLTLTSAQNVEAFLPQGGTASPFNQSYIDVTTTSAGVLGGQLVAATMNVYFSEAGFLGTGTPALGHLVIVTGPFTGLTVYELLDIANTAIGGGSTSYSFSQINDALTALNENFNSSQPGNFLDCADVQKASLGDRVWNDSNQNGIQDFGEQGVANVIVKLYDCLDNLVATTTTNANGLYLFSNLNPGDYYVKFELPGGYEFTLLNQGSDTEKDSDADPVTGKTICITLAAGENNMTIDAGIYEPQPLLGSIGDFVWNDSNGNGIQDNGEQGVANVTVKLYDCFDNLVATTTTNANGLYLFSNLNPGEYYVKFELPGGYEFTLLNQGSDNEKDSDADQVTGKTICFTLSAGQNDMSRDAGLISIQHLPELEINKDDGLLIMPGVDGTTTYTITYANTGLADLLNAKITDNLPAGVIYISSTGGGNETAPGVVEWNLGSLAAGQSGSVTLTVKVTVLKPEYLNVACLSGNDSFDNDYEVCDDDLNIGDETSNGGDAGIESRGDMAELLLKRVLKIQAGETIPMLALNKSAFSGKFSLSQVIPNVGPYNSYAVESTPFDILGISNATSSYAVNYIMPQENNRRIGGAFSTTTNPPYVYDHTKQVCDRLAGYIVDELQLLKINGNDFYAAKLMNAETHVIDRAISFAVYETAGGFIVDNRWSYSDYVVPQDAQLVYNFQVWSSTFEGAVELVEKIVGKFSTNGVVSYINNNLAKPDVFIKNARYTHDGKAMVTFVNNSENQSVDLQLLYRTSQGETQKEMKNTVVVKSGVNEVELEIGIISDANLLVRTPGGFGDEVFVSGGSYAYTIGPSSTVNSFKTKGYSVQNPEDYPEESLILSGGAKVSGKLGDWTSIVRSLNASASAYDLSEFRSIRFEARGSGSLDIIFDKANTENYNYYTSTVSLSNEFTEYVIDFAQFNERNGKNKEFDASLIKTIGFILDKGKNSSVNNFELEVKNIAFLKSGKGQGGDGMSPEEYTLAQNYPNPFNPSTTIEFYLADAGHVMLAVYDILGQQVAALVNGTLNEGRHSISFDAANLTSGIYFYRLSGNDVNITKKMILQK